MATNYIQDGQTVQYTCTGAVTTGAFIPLPATGANQKMVGVAATSGVTGDSIALFTEGVFSVSTKKAQATAGIGQWRVGDDIYLTATGDFTGTATANGFAGTAWEAAATSATTGKIRINYGGDPR
jgi:predicted RecA/RadA family phage recombinase